MLAEIALGSEVFVVRRAAVGDLPALVGLLADDPLGAGREETGGDLGPYERALAAVDADPAQVLVAVTDAAGEVVATLQLTVLQGLSRRGAARAQVEAVRVHERLRGRGLGEALMRWAIEEARRRGCALIQLTTDKRRVGARRFYARLGFEATHEGMKLHL